MMLKVVLPKPLSLFRLARLLLFNHGGVRVRIEPKIDRSEDPSIVSYAAADATQASCPEADRSVPSGSLGPERFLLPKTYRHRDEPAALANRFPRPIASIYGD